jgi:hypothetical protein
MSSSKNTPTSDVQCFRRLCVIVVMIGHAVTKTGAATLPRAPVRGFAVSFRFFCASRDVEATAVQATTKGRHIHLTYAWHLLNPRNNKPDSTNAGCVIGSLAPESPSTSAKKRSRGSAISRLWRRKAESQSHEASSRR